MKFFFNIIFLFSCFSILSQNRFDGPVPATWTDYQSEYEWLDSHLLKFSFFSYRRHGYNIIKQVQMGNFLTLVILQFFIKEIELLQI
jgi:hypothetical protein